MTNHTPNAADALLDREIERIKTMPMPEGPSPALVPATLQRLSGGATPHRPTPWNLLIENVVLLSRQPLVRLAAAIVIVVGLYALLASPFGSSIAFAQVAEQMKEARSISYRVSMSAASMPSMSSKALIGARGQSRRELPGGSLLIMNGNSGLLLSPELHTATKFDLTNQTRPQGPDTAQQVLESFRNLQKADAKPLGEKKIDGVAVRGFATQLADLPVELWADAKTAVPVRMEWTADVGSNNVHVILSDFKLDEPVDESTFSTEVPAGYTVKTQKLPTIKPGELPQDVATVIGEYAKLSDGEFPASLTDWSDFTKASLKLGEDKQMEMISRVGSISGQLFSRPGGYVYAGKGVKLGEKDKAVFWLKPAANQKTTQVVYGDLRVESIAVEQLPKP